MGSSFWVQTGVCLKMVHFPENHLCWVGVRSCLTLPLLSNFVTHDSQLDTSLDYMLGKMLWARGIFTSHKLPQCLSAPFPTQSAFQRHPRQQIWRAWGRSTYSWITLLPLFPTLHNMKNLAIKIHRDFPSSPVVKNCAFNVVSVGSVTSRGTKIHMPHSGAKNKK